MALRAFRIIATVLLIPALIISATALEAALFVRLTALNPNFYRLWLAQRGFYDAVYDAAMESATRQAQDTAEDETGILADIIREVLPRDEFTTLCAGYLGAMAGYLSGHEVTEKFDFTEIISGIMLHVMIANIEPTLPPGIPVGDALHQSGLTAAEIFALDTAAFAQLVGLTPEQAASFMGGQSGFQPLLRDVEEQTRLIPLSSNWSREAEIEFAQSTRDMREALTLLGRIHIGAWVAWAVSAALLFALWGRRARAPLVTSGVLLALNGVLLALPGALLMLAMRSGGRDFRSGIAFAPGAISDFIVKQLIPAAGRVLMLTGGAMGIAALLLWTAAYFAEKQRPARAGVPPPGAL
jgi:hypothetical protein